VRGRCPRAPGIYRLSARIPGPGERGWIGRLALPESRPLAGAPVASLRCRTLRPGPASISLFRRRHEKDLLKRHRSGYKYPCPGSPSLAGFEVSTDGRFSGVHRGSSQSWARSQADCLTRTGPNAYTTVRANRSAARKEVMKAHTRLNDFLSRGIIPKDLKQAGGEVTAPSTFSVRIALVAFLVLKRPASCSTGFPSE
jgi:hypothetical protein